MAQTVDAVLNALAGEGVRINPDGSIGPLIKRRK
jgi:hypothetical protein